MSYSVSYKLTFSSDTDFDVIKLIFLIDLITDLMGDF